MGSARQSLSADQFKSTAPPEDIEIKPYFPGGRGQGKFFKDPKPTPQHRWAQQGFSPERRAEVEANMPPIVHSPGIEKVLEKRGLDKDVPVSPNRWAIGAKLRRRLATENIARSTAPAEDLQGLYKIRVDDPNTIRMNMGEGTAGYYQTEKETGIGPQITVDPSTVASKTLIHEVGHHVSHQDPASGYRRVAVEQGVMPREEAFADQYMLEHYQPTRKEQKSRHIPHTYADVYPHWMTKDEEGRQLGLTTGEHPYAEERRGLGEMRGRPLPLSPRQQARYEKEKGWRAENLQEKLFRRTTPMSTFGTKEEILEPQAHFKDNPFSKDIWSRIKEPKVRGRGQA